MKESEISWTTHTMNPWWGCARVSPGCVHCYADTLASRWGHELWRRHGPRRPMSDQYWRQPLTWNRKAADADGPVRVFCASMADVFEDHPEPDVRAFQDSQRARLWDLIEATPHLVWMLLTKRPQNVGGMVPWGEDWPSTVWLGTSVEDQRRANERIPVLLNLPASTRFLSCEPLLAPVDLSVTWMRNGTLPVDPLSPHYDQDTAISGRGIHWVICGGESGRKAWPMHPDWVRSLRDQCTAAGVAFHLKQWGEYRWVAGSRYDHDTKCWVDDGIEPQRVGKGKAGRLLDGREWSEFPAGSAA